MSSAKTSCYFLRDIVDASGSWMNPKDGIIFSKVSHIDSKGCYPLAFATCTVAFVLHIRLILWVRVCGTISVYPNFNVLLAMLMILYG